MHREGCDRVVRARLTYTLFFSSSIHEPSACSGLERKATAKELIEEHASDEQQAQSRKLPDTRSITELQA
ncbi:hypothetical protein KTH_10650 [Thermosporothrix hazakensis]|uniref:Uncharacterized protein n=1 Tax=Thermosporothrix sp. COM3 TaxID=2490863 RepID=A0A455SJY8_9CHLR|nr:hypothetical protein KTC_01250 [Thermosporothrix sp. COM3]GCE46196.1 hypothetical protein KTH_10650 [Thermosporothrix hazakensis]